MTAKKPVKTKSQWMVLKGVPAKVVHAVFDDEQKALDAAEKLIQKGEAEFASIEHRIVPAASKESAGDGDASDESGDTKEGE